MDEIRREQEILSAFVHGVLAFGHSLGIIYNLKHRKWFWVAFHIIAFGLDLWAVYMHYKDASAKDSWGEKKPGKRYRTI